jgi:hypothetical protein
MAFDAGTVDRVRQRLGDRFDFVEKRMVGGGLSFSVNGCMCCGVSGADLMIRVGAQTRDATLAQPHVRPMVLGGRQLAGFVLVEPAGFQTDDALAGWIGRALDFVATMSQDP